MACKLLYALYGKGTRPAQALNIIVAVWWFLVMAINNAGLIMFDIPANLIGYSLSGMMFTLAIIVFGGVSFGFEGKARYITKSFALLLGALWQAIVANMYVSQYPPLSMMMCVSVVLSIWFIGAVFYIAKCEE